MPPRRLHLRDDANPDHAIQFLRDRAQAATNLAGATSWGPDQVERRRDAYLTWVEETENFFTNHTHDADLLSMLYTPGYWEIRQAHANSVRPIPLIEFETRRQIANLDALREDLSRRRDRALAGSGHITIVDTNVLLHYQLPDGIDWPAVVGQSDVRLVLPLRVVEELDAKKYTESEKVRRKARALLPKLHNWVGQAGAAQAMSDHATIEVLTEPGPRTRPSDADTEILETAHALRQLSGQGVTIVTADTGMALRGETEGIPTVLMPKEYRRD